MQSYRHTQLRVGSMGTKSTHKAPVIRLNREKHPNADRMFIQRVGGWQVCGSIADWENHDLAVYIQPDSVVDVRQPEFSWLSDPKIFHAAQPDNSYLHHVTAKRLRGVISYGFLARAPSGLNEGDDAAEALGITRFDPILPPGVTLPPSGYRKDYDLEAFEAFSNVLLKDGEEVILLEKLNGVNARFCYVDGRLHVGSKNVWLEPSDSVWWRVGKQLPSAFVDFLKSNPNITVYGEIFGYAGNNTKLRYGLAPGQLDFRVFDLLRDQEFVNFDECATLVTSAGVKTVPVVLRTPYSEDVCRLNTKGPTLIEGAKHGREGIVVRSTQERQELQGRVSLKLVDWENA